MPISPARRVFVPGVITWYPLKDESELSAETALFGDAEGIGPARTPMVAMVAKVAKRMLVCMFEVRETTCR